MSSVSLWSRLVRSIAGTKTTQKSIKRPMRAFPSLESLEGRTVPATAILNPTGGLTSTDGIRTEFADGQFMVYKNNVRQLYNGFSVPTDNNFNSIYLSVGNDTVGGTVIGYLAPGTWSKAGSNMTRSNWTNVNTSAVSTSGANSFFTSSMSYTNATGTYVVDLRVDYTANDVFHKQTYTVTIPSANAKDVRLYMTYDTYLGGSDAGPGYVDSTGDPTVNNGVVEVGVYGSTVTESIQYVSGIAWESYASMAFPRIVRSYSGYGPGFGTPFTNEIDGNSNTDNGIGINWNFGSTPGVQAPVAYNFTFNTPAPPDTTPPATPVITSVTVDTGSSTTDQITNDNTLTFTGTAEANSAVKVFNGTTLIGTAKASSKGAYAVTASVLPDGTYPNFRVTATDAAGNQSGAATVTPWTIDTVSNITVTGVASDTGSSSTDKITNDNTLTITGMAEPNSLVAVFDNGVQVGTATASGTGAYSVTTSALSDASHVLTITAADIAGNVSSSTPLGTWIVDTIAPSSTPVVVSVTVDTGSSTTDQITSDNTLTFTGTAEANSVVQVFNGTTLIGTTMASGTGAYAVTASVLPDGTYPNFRVTASDLAGNQSGAATVTPWTIDTTAPATPLVASVTVDTGISTTDQITSDNTLTVTGTAAANSIVNVFDGGVLVGTTTASGTGAYSVTTSVLADGVHSALTVTATDLAGNASGAATITPWTIDTVAPVVDMVADSTDSDGTYRKGQTLTIELTLDEVVYVNGIPCLDLNSGGLAEYVSGSGTNTLVFTYTIQRGESTPVGDYLSVLGFDLTNGSITDAAGNIPAVLLNAVTNGNLDANNQLVVESRLGVTLVPYAGSFIDDTVTPGSGKTNLASLSYLATFDEVVDNFPRQALQTSGLLLTSVHRIADKTGLHWKIDAKPTNALGTLGSTSIQVVASTLTDVLMNTNLSSNVVTVDVLRDMKMTSTLSAGANSAKVIGRVTTLSGLSVVFSGPVDPTTVVASAFNTYATGVISNIVVAADNLSATFDLNINNGGTAFNGSVRFNVIDKAIQDEYGNKVKGGKQIQWTYDGQGATAVFASSAAARVRAGQQIEWTVKFSEAVAFSKGNLTVTIGGVTVNSSQISVRGSGSSYTVTLKTTTALKGALVVAMKSGSAGPLDLRGNQMAVIPSNLAKTTII